MIYNDIPKNIIGIYKINFPNGKIYIERAKNIKTRIWEHFSKKDNTICQSAIYKYYSTYQDIDIDILETFDNYNFKLICEREKYWIKYYNSFEDKIIGYNMSEGGDGADTGINNPSACFDKANIETVYQLLQQGLTNESIAAQFNVHPDTIGRINQGKSYFNNNLNYPIRKKDNKAGFHNGAAKNKEIYAKIINLLKTTKLSREEIAKQTNSSVSLISSLNQGKHFYCKTLTENFPIRINNRRNNKLTEEEIQQIKNDLKNSNLSIIKLAEKYHCSRDTIGDINNGKIYSILNELYPIRIAKKKSS